MSTMNYMLYHPNTNVTILFILLGMLQYYLFDCGTYRVSKTSHIPSLFIGLYFISLYCPLAGLFFGFHFAHELYLKGFLCCKQDYSQE